MSNRNNTLIDNLKTLEVEFDVERVNLFGSSEQKRLSCVSRRMVWLKKQCANIQLDQSLRTKADREYKALLWLFSEVGLISKW